MLAAQGGSEGAQRKGL